MDEFIRPRRQNIRQQGFWKIANGGSDNEADPQDQIENQTAEALNNLDYAIAISVSQNSSLTPHDSISQIQPLIALLNPFLEPPKPKRQRKETSWVYTHFQRTILEEKTFFDKATGKIKADTQYSCLYCVAPEEWITVKSVTKGSTSNLQKHLGQTHGIYKDQDTHLGIYIFNNYYY
jgi:hypothetical protein